MLLVKYSLSTTSQPKLQPSHAPCFLVLQTYSSGVLSVVRLTGQHPTNVALSDDEKTGYVTMQKRGAIERFSTVR